MFTAQHKRSLIVASILVIISKGSVEVQVAAIKKLSPSRVSAPCLAKQVLNNLFSCYFFSEIKRLTVIISDF